MAHSVDSYSDTKLALQLKRFNCKFLVRPSIDRVVWICRHNFNKHRLYIKKFRGFWRYTNSKISPENTPLYPHLEVLNKKNELDGKILIIMYPYCIPFQVDDNILILFQADDNILILIICVVSLLYEIYRQTFILIDILL